MDEQPNVCTLADLIEKNQIKLTKKQKAYLKLKRAFDFLCSLFLLVLLSPVFLICAVVIKIDAPKEKVIFKQKRVGKNLKPFWVYKFRSMKTDSPELSTSEFENAEHYITKVGKFMRKTSLDELPQLYCCLIGTMSLIGPRPLMGREKEIHFLRHYYGIYQIRPGITGLAQINGRDEMGNYDKVRWDRAYVYNVSPALDLKILWNTVGKVLHRDGVVDEAAQKRFLKKEGTLGKAEYNSAVEVYDKALQESKI